MKKGRIDILRAGLAVAGAFALVVFPAAGNANAAIGNIVVTSAASFEAGVPAKGSIATIFCTGLEGISGTVAAQSTPLPRELAGVRVRVGGAEAPIFAVASMPGYQQINIQVPQEAAIQLPSAWPAGDNEAWVDVVVEQGARRASVRVAMRKAAGDFFELGDGFAILQHASDYSLVTRDNPARPEEDLIAYLTGMLGTFPEVPTGMPSPSDPPATVPSRGISFSEHGIDLRLSVNSVTALSYGFIGLTPGLVGVYQINFKLREQELLFLYHPLTLFETELRLIRTYCPTGGGCHPTTPVAFEGTGSIWTARMVDKRIFPAIDIHKSGTPEDELLLEHTSEDVRREYLIEKSCAPYLQHLALAALREQTRSRRQVDIRDQ